MAGASWATAFVRLKVDAADIAKQTDAGLAAGAKGKGYALFSKAVTGAAVAGVTAAGTIGAASIKMAADFQAGLTTLVTGAGESEKNLGIIAAGIKNIAVATGTPTKALTDGLYLIESAGYHGAAGLNVLKAAAEGAKVGNADLATVANAVTTVMTDYALKGPGAAANATNALITITASGKTHLQDLAGSMARVLPTAAALHVSLGDVGGALATMTGEGTSARLASMGLNAVLLSLAAPTSAASKHMAELGLSSKTVAETLTKKGLVAALDLVQQAALRAGPQGSAPYVAAMKEMLGGTNQLRVGLQLAGPHAATFAKNVADVAASARGAGKDVKGWDLVQKDFNQQLDVLKARAQVAGITLGQDLLPIVSSLFALFSQHAVLILGFIGAILGIAVAAKTVMLALRTWEIAQAVWAAVTSSSLIETAALWVMYTLGVEAAGVATIIATGGIILIIAALVAAGFELYEHWNTVWSFVKQIAVDVFDWLKVNWPLIAAILLGPVTVAALEIYKHWTLIKGYFTDALSFITGLFSRVGDFIAAPFIAAFDKVKTAITAGFDKWWASNGEAVKQVWAAVWGALAAIFHAFWDPLMIVLRAGWVVLQALFTAGSAVIRAVWSVAWSAITAVARTEWAVLQALFTAGMAVITTLWRAGWAVVSTVFRLAWVVIQAAWRAGWVVIEDVLRVAWAVITAVVRTSWDILVGIFTVSLQLLTGHWSAAWNTIRTVAGQVTGNILGVFRTFWSALSSGFQAAVSAVARIWGGIETAAMTPVRFVIGTVYNRGIVPVVDAIAGVAGLHPLNAIQGFAGGTSGAPPGWAWVGENGPELIRMLGGETVLSNRQSMATGLWGTGPGYANGTVQPGRLGGLQGGDPLAGVGGVTSSIANAIKTGIAGLRSLAGDALAAGINAVMNPLINAIPGMNTRIGGYVKSDVQKVEADLVNWVKGKTAVAAAAAAGGVYLGAGSGNYAADITAVLKQLGLPLSLVSNWLRQIATESGGNLSAVNRTDSNWLAGHPSVGILQLIPSTFAAYAGPYRNTPPLVNEGGGFVSLNPMAQIYAAIRYAATRYDGAAMAGVIGQGHGYADGTPSARRGWAWVGEHGVPELVHFGGGEQVGPVAGGRRRGGDPQLAQVTDLLSRLIDTTAAVPAGVARHVGGAISGAGRDASFRGRYSNGGW